MASAGAGAEEVPPEEADSTAFLRISWKACLCGLRGCVWGV